MGAPAAIGGLVTLLAGLSSVFDVGDMEDPNGTLAWLGKGALEWGEWGVDGVSKLISQVARLIPGVDPEDFEPFIPWIVAAGGVALTVGKFFPSLKNLTGLSIIAAVGMIALTISKDPEKSQELAAGLGLSDGTVTTPAQTQGLSAAEIEQLNAPARSGDVLPTNSGLIQRADAGDSLMPATKQFAAATGAEPVTLTRNFQNTGNDGIVSAIKTNALNGAKQHEERMVAAVDQIKADAVEGAAETLQEKAFGNVGNLLDEAEDHLIGSRGLRAFAGLDPNNIITGAEEPELHLEEGVA